MPKLSINRILVMVLTTAVAVAIIWRFAPLKKVVTGES
jgi:hypothetical protein